MGVFNTTIKSLSGLGLGEAASAAKAKIIHQRILKRICAYIDNIVLPNFEAVNEGEIGGTDTEIPDIVLWSLDKNLINKNPLVAIEITTTDCEGDNIDKLRDLFFSYPTLKECFLFNYDTGEWFEVTKNGGILENSESEYIKQQTGQKCDFNEPLMHTNIKHLFGLKKRKRKKF